MKTPDEIKQGLKCCGVMTAREQPCKVCPYSVLCREKADESHLLPDALAYINLLEERIRGMQLQMMGDCGVCKHKDDSERCVTCLSDTDGGHPRWEYEGFPTDMEKEDDHETAYSDHRRDAP